MPFAGLYAALAPQFHPREVDEMEIWEVAIILKPELIQTNGNLLAPLMALTGR